MTASRAEIEAQLLAALRAQNGLAWCEVQGELQERDGECAIWVLLYEDSDPQESHRILCDLVSPVMQDMEPVQFTVSYSILTELLDISVDTLMDNDEILGALEDISFGKNPMSRTRQPFTVFQSAVSGTKP